MGVIHKLKEEVVDFIIDIKKENVSISCRQLAVLTMERFQKKISKSSINAILKEAQLSSSVGRRREFHSPTKIKKFQIPGQKKKELFENIHKLETEHKDNFPLLSIAENSLREHLTDKENKEAPADILPLNASPKADAEEVRKDPGEHGILEETKPSEPRLSLLADKGIQEFYFDFSSQEEKSCMFDGAGTIFLKAAEWEISTKSFLGTLLRKYADNSLPDGFDALCETILFRELCGLSKKQDGDLYIPQAADEFNRLSLKTENDLNERNFSEEENFTKNIEFSQQLIMEYVTEKRQSFLEISGFKLTLEDTTALLIDGQMRSVWKDKIDKDKFCPIEKAMTGLTRDLITNSAACVVAFQYSDEEIPHEIRQLIACFEGVEGKRIRSVEVYDDDSNAIAFFSAIPAKKRHFIIGLDLSQKRLGEWAKRIGLKGSNDSNLEDLSQGAEMGSQDRQVLTQKKEKFFSFIEKKTIIVGEDDRESIAVRIVSLWQDKCTEPVLAILTNIEEETAKDVLRVYFEKFPWRRAFENMDIDADSVNRGFAGSVGLEDSKSFDLQPEEDEFNNIKNLKDIFQSFGGELHKYCVKHYFSQERNDQAFSYFQEKYYHLKGFIQKTPTRLYVTLKPPPNYPYLPDLFEAVKNINERFVFDWSLRKLLISIDLQ